MFAIHLPVKKLKLPLLDSASGFQRFVIDFDAPSVTVVCHDGADFDVCNTCRTFAGTLPGFHFYLRPARTNVDLCCVTTRS